MKVKKKKETKRILHYKIPEQYQKGRNLLHCNYCNFWYSIFALLLFGMGFYISVGVSCMLYEEMKGEYLFFVFMAFLGLPFIAGGLLFVFFIKNWGLIFYDGGIWYRSLGGKVYQYSDCEVDGYLICTVPKYRYIMIKLKNKKNIFIGGFGKNYHEAQELVQRRYTKR